MRIDHVRAADFFRHKSQQIGDIDPDNLPSEGFHYFSQGPVCGVFHLGPMPDVFFAHYAVKPEKWGHLRAHAKAVLREAAFELGAIAIVGWTDTKNRAALAFNRRIGFESRGEIAPGITEQVWRP